MSLSHSYVRDEISGSVVSNNVSELQKYRSLRNKKLETQDRLSTLELNIKTINSNINNINAVIKNMLVKFSD